MNYGQRLQLWQPVITIHFEILQYQLMSRPILLITALLAIAHAQSNICYANCKKGYCAANNASACSDCDLGTLNINHNCVTTNIQPAPITLFKPNTNNTLLDFSSYLVQFCNITTKSIANTMLFQPQIGNSFTQKFNIPVDYSYLHIKFNAIILTTTPATQPLSLLVNLVPANNRRAFILSKTENVSPNAVNVSCNSVIKNIKNYYGVFLMDYKTSDNNKSIILEVLPQGLVNAYIAVSDIELYYGSCDTTCATCVGPTSAQCSSCKGLLLTLTNSTCSGCPTGFYQNVTCFPCPVLCQTCSYSNKKIVCLTCKSGPTLQFKLVNGSCQLTQFVLTTLNDVQLPFDYTNWTSSEVLTSPLSQCGAYTLLGGISIGVSNSDFTYLVTNLPVHSNVYIFYTLFLVDQTPLDLYQYELRLDTNVRQINFTIPSQNMTNECGGSQLDYIKPENYSFLHNATTAKLTITVYKSYMGIREFLFIVDNPTTDPNCLLFNSTTNQCTQCRNALVIANSTCSACLDGFYLMPVNNTFYCKACPFACSTCNLTNATAGTVVCLTCRPPLTLDSGYCVDSNQNLFNAEVLTTIPLKSQLINFINYPNLQNKGIDACDNQQIIGTTTIKSKFLKMSRQFSNLSAHTGVILYLTLYQIDDNYFPNNSLWFVFNSKIYTQDNLTNITQYASIKQQICGNDSWDSRFVVALKDDSHTANSLDFSINVNRMAKIGINNLQLYLLNTPMNNATSYKLEVLPSYSINTPPVKGVEVKITFNSDFIATSDVASAFVFSINNITNTTSRLLQQSRANPLVAQNQSSSNRQILYLLNLTQDYNDQYQLQVRPSSQNSVYFPSGAGSYSLISQSAVSVPMTRYINIDQSSINDRSSMRNLFNLFRGCAILALFFGLASFLFGMSAAFDDFFILCQVVFVHVFIQLSYNPPSIVIPFSGLHIVQFMQWLPEQARKGIQNGIIPDNLYQATPLVFQQFFQDTVFARTIYHTIIYFGLILGFWLVMHISLLIYESKNPNEKVKYENFFVFFYKQYDNKRMVFVDKMVRFAYFTIVWACILQFISFSNTPTSFHNWNSALAIVMLLFVLVYPAVMYYLLHANANSLTDKTFDLAFEQLRINKDSLYYYLIRYYKLFIIAVVVATTYNSSPVVPLIILIALNAIDVAFIIRMNPLGMIQPELIQATIFYPWYPKVYYYTSVAQQFLFIVMQIFFLIMIGVRSKGSSSAYMGLGYAVCAFVILLLLNGLVRLIWGVLKIVQYCYLQRQSNYLSIEKEIHQNDPVEPNQLLGVGDGRTQTYISKRDLESKLKSMKKLSYVSKIR